jgi:hypothetical protein
MIQPRVDVVAKDQRALVVGVLRRERDALRGRGSAYAGEVA